MENATAVKFITRDDGYFETTHGAGFYLVKETEKAVLLRGENDYCKEWRPKRTLEFIGMNTMFSGQAEEKELQYPVYKVKSW